MRSTDDPFRLERFVQAQDPVFDNTPAFGDPESFRLDAASPCKTGGKSDGTSGGVTCEQGAFGNGVHTRIGYG